MNFCAVRTDYAQTHLDVVARIIDSSMHNKCFLSILGRQRQNTGHSIGIIKRSQGYYCLLYEILLDSRSTGAMLETSVSTSLGHACFPKHQNKKKLLIYNVTYLHNDLRRELVGGVHEDYK